MRRERVQLVLLAALSVVLLAVLGTRLTGLPPLGILLDPSDGLDRTARLADAPAPDEFNIPGLMSAVQIEWDDRGVPHIFAENEIDAVRAIGFAVARDRLFQLDFLPRAASGRLSEALGAATVSADQFLRRTGMDWGARKNLERMIAEDGIELQILEAYADGVNAYLQRLKPRDLPLEFRLLGYEPDPWTPIQTLRLLQYMNYDLSYGTDQPSYAPLRERLTEEDFNLLYPRHAELYVPIIPRDEPLTTTPSVAHIQNGKTNAHPSMNVVASNPAQEFTGADDHALEWAATFRRPEPDSDISLSILEGFIHGKGSNNWAVAPSRSATGRPILAGDMHLALTLPSIWYEVHVVTPDMNAYGVTIPGAPLPVEAFNDYVAWAFTNTGSDQIDHYQLNTDESGRRYLYEGAWCDFELVSDTIFVKGERPIVDTLRYTHSGPVVDQGFQSYSLRWTAHDSSRTLLALRLMNTARDSDDFEEGLRYWDSPMQNIVYADVEGTISIRSTGYLPVRKGGDGAGLLDGSTSSSEWIGRVPFDELPFAVNPNQGYLTSTNQQPADSTYAYYTGWEWRDQYRSLRIDSLLRGREKHSVADIAEYQSDVHAVQYDLFFPFLDTLSGVTGKAESLVEMLGSWNGDMTVERPEPLILDVFLGELERLAWDEPEFDPMYIAPTGDTLSSPVHVPPPHQSLLVTLLGDAPMSKWIDIIRTGGREDAAGLLRAALQSAVERMDREFGWGQGSWRWGNHRQIQLKHLIDSPALQALGRGPVEFPGYRETLSPAGGRVTTHSASWRVVVDFSSGRPQGQGIYPGGQSGNPFSRRYDLHLPAYVSFDYYDLLKPSSRGELDEARILGKTTLQPVDQVN